jgi:hypothetical protein
LIALLNIIGRFVRYSISNRILLPPFDIIIRRLSISISFSRFLLMTRVFLISFIFSFRFSEFPTSGYWGSWYTNGGEINKNYSRRRIKAGILKRGGISVETVMMMNSKYGKINRACDAWKAVVQNKFFIDSIMREGELETRIRKILWCYLYRLLSGTKLININGSPTLEWVINGMKEEYVRLN